MAFYRTPSVPSFRNNRVLQQYLLTDAIPTGTILGRGHYGTILEISYGNVKFAAKKMHDTLLTDNEELDTLEEKYEQLCQLMDSLHHPNITQFLGICYLPDTQLPLLVVEQLDMSLEDKLQFGTNFSLTVKVSVLKDVCSGLNYLHKRNPPIVHRDLIARNVHLTLSLTAKITGIENSHIDSMKPNEFAKTLLALPERELYMPPEVVCGGELCYGPSLDIFSLGHLSLYVLTEVFPLILLPYTFRDHNYCLQGRTEVQRRGTYMEKLETCVCQNLVCLVKKCLSDNPRERPTSEDLLEEVHVIRRELEKLPNDGNLLKYTDVEGVQESKRIDENQDNQELYINGKMNDKTTTRENFQQPNVLPHKQFDHQNDVLHQQSDPSLHKEEQQLERMKARVDEQLHQQKIKTKLEEDVQQEKMQLEEKEELLQQTLKLQHMQEVILAQKVDLQHKDKELQQQKEALQQKNMEIRQQKEEVQCLREEVKQKDKTIKHLRFEITKQMDGVHPSIAEDTPQKRKKLRQRNSVIQFPLQVDWTRGPNMPIEMSMYIQSVELQGTVFVGGGLSFSIQKECTVMAYGSHSSKWHRLPPYVARRFAMVVINSQLVLVGGKDSTGATNLLSAWDATSETWISHYERMPTARSYPSAVVNKQWLIVAGGKAGSNQVSTVEVLDVTKNQWYSAPSTPTPWSHMKSATLNDVWYLTGGYTDELEANDDTDTADDDTDTADDDTDTVYSISLPELISYVISSSSSSSCDHLWREISGPGYIGSTPVCIGGTLLSVGGRDVHSNYVSTIYRYVPKNEQWIKAGHIPYATNDCACISTSNEQVLLFGEETLFYIGNLM